MRKFNNEQPEESRNNDLKILKAFENFEFVTDSEAIYGTCGNIKYKFENYESLNSYTTKYGKDNQQAFYELVSAPMLLSRLVAAGCIPFVEGQNGYKTTWNVILKHKTTGCIATFYDWKGASSYGSCYKGLENNEFQKDLLELLKALINPRFPHPYDGCVVGEIA